MKKRYRSDKIHIRIIPAEICLKYCWNFDFDLVCKVSHSKYSVSSYSVLYSLYYSLLQQWEVVFIAVFSGGVVKPQNYSVQQNAGLPVLQQLQQTSLRQDTKVCVYVYDDFLLCGMLTRTCKGTCKMHLQSSNNILVNCITHQSGHVYNLHGNVCTLWICGSLAMLCPWIFANFETSSKSNPRGITVRSLHEYKCWEVFLLSAPLIEDNVEVSCNIYIVLFWQCSHAHKECADRCYC